LPNAYAPWDLASDQQLQQLQQLQQPLELNSIIKPGWRGSRSNYLLINSIEKLDATNINLM